LSTTATPPPSVPRPGRRGFLAAIFWASSAALTGALGSLVALFLRDPGPSGPEETEVRLGGLPDLAGNGFHRFTARVEVQRHWRKEENRKVVYARLDEERKPLVLLARCPHMGCTVRWEEDEDNFVCPCHHGRFDANGQRISGPPPRGLRVLSAELREEQLWVRFPFEV